VGIIVTDVLQVSKPLKKAILGLALGEIRMSTS
jgi:hypothetical protein